MKVVFNFIGRAGRLRAPLFVVAVALGVLGVPRPAEAQAVYWTTRDLLAEFFKSSQRVSFRKVELDPAERARVEKRLGYPLPQSRTSYTFFVAETQGRVDGYALFDDEVGQHLPISFAVKMSPAGTVERQEIVAYRESHGDEVRDARFRAQFVGKSARDRLRAGDDVVAISGATISSRAMATGVKRALVLLDELVLRGGGAAGGTVTARR
jgi:Na+-translocating ferredoxin:NAD+ oxidoreductase RnfG subunit